VGGAVDVVVVDIADEAGHIDASRAGAHARGIIAVEAAGRFDHRLTLRQRWRQVGELACERIVRCGWMGQVFERLDHLWPCG
jgi:hypothetical protein